MKENKVYRVGGASYIIWDADNEGGITTVDVTCLATAKDKNSCIDDEIIPGSGDDKYNYYCTTTFTAAVSFWAIIHLLPIITLNMVILITTLRRNVVKTCLTFPPLVISGLFSPFLFGPLGGVKSWWRGGRRMCLSWSLTVANMVLAVAQAAVSIIVLMGTHVGVGEPVAEFLFKGI